MESILPNDAFKNELRQTLYSFYTHILHIFCVISVPSLVYISHKTTIALFPDYVYIESIVFFALLYLAHYGIYIRLQQKKIDFDFIGAHIIQKKKNQLEMHLKRHSIDPEPLQHVAKQTISYINLLHGFMIIDVFIILCCIGLCSIVALFFIPYTTHTLVSLAFTIVVYIYGPKPTLDTEM